MHSDCRHQLCVWHGGLTTRLPTQNSRLCSKKTKMSSKNSNAWIDVMILSRNDVAHGAPYKYLLYTKDVHLLLQRLQVILSCGALLQGCLELHSQSCHLLFLCLQ